jgi:hypothetical protein
VLVGQPHWPPAHTRPAAQIAPQAPQFWMSPVRSTQARLQSVSVPQSGAHVPVRQTCAVGHAVPQAPQFAGSVATFAHAAPHAMRPVAQAQLPFVHAVPGKHATPQLPQFALFDCVSVHAPPHTMPLVHVHVPFVHV